MDNRRISPGEATAAKVPCGNHPVGFDLHKDSGVDHLMPTNPPTAPDPLFIESVVWEKGEDGMLTYHVPTIQVTSAGTVLAAADARYEEHGDFGPHHLVIKRSIDQGLTWSRNIYLGLSDQKQIFLFPNIVQAAGSQRLFLFYAEKVITDIHRAAHVWVRHSDDDGLSWSEPRSVSDILIRHDAALGELVRKGEAGPQFARDNYVHYGRRSFYPGPGVAIRLSPDHPVAPNRLVVPFLGMGDRFSYGQQRGFFNTILVSDDDGSSWQAGGTVPIGAFRNSEPSIIEMGNGDLLFNIRVEKQHFRVAARSTDGGGTWSEARRVGGLPLFDQVHAGLLRYTFSRHDPTGTNRLLFCFPNGDPYETAFDQTADAVGRWRRERMSIWMSYDEHLSWPVKKVVHDGPSFYSNMAAGPGDDLYLIYGRGGNHAWIPDHTVVSRFNLEWLTDGKDTLQTGPRFF